VFSNPLARITVVPAKAGMHFSAWEIVAAWVPIFFGTMRVANKQ